VEEAEVEEAEVEEAEVEESEVEEAGPGTEYGEFRSGSFRHEGARRQQSSQTEEMAKSSSEGTSISYPGRR
jgi:hypothetical protein